MLISLLIATVAVPMITARARTTNGAIRATVIATVLFCAAYLAGLFFVYQGVTPR